LPTRPKRKSDGAGKVWALEGSGNDLGTTSCQRSDSGRCTVRDVTSWSVNDDQAPLVATLVALNRYAMCSRADQVEEMVNVIVRSRPVWLVVVVGAGALVAAVGLGGHAQATAARGRPAQSSAVGTQLGQLAAVGAPTASARAFGVPVAATRNVIVVGTTWRSQHRIGAYVYVRGANGSFGRSPAARLTVDFPSANGLHSVAISGNTVVIGDLAAHAGQGAAFVFVRPKGVWRSEHQTAMLTAGTAGTGVGFAVGVSGNTIVATSTPNTLPGAPPSMSYVYRRPAGGWCSTKPVASLSLSGTPAKTVGFSVAINPTTIAVGDPLAGKIDVYARPAGGWRSRGPTGILTSKSDPARDRLGQTIAMNGNTIAASTQIRGRHPGYWYSAIAVFTQPANGWRSAHPTATLTARHQSESDDYGFSLAISNSMILAGGPQGKVGNNETGTAYVFDRPAGGWRDGHDSQRLAATRPRPNGQFGYAAAIAGQNPVIGAPATNGGHGAAYVFGP
jgi:hypothetical protein